MDIKISVVLQPSFQFKDKIISVEENGCLHLYYCKVSSGYAARFFCESIPSAIVPADNLCSSDKALEFSLKISPTCTLLLRAFNKTHYKQFSEALVLIADIADKRLQLNMCLREVVIDGILSNDINSTTKNTSSLNNLGDVLTRATSTVLKNIVNCSTESSEVSNTKRSKVKALATACTGRLNYSDLACVYCDVPGNPELLNLRVHPYVPVAAARRVLYLCHPCHANWLGYRRDACVQNLLILPGEFNEEICSVCSDSPPELVLCSSCPRSYCSPCLTKLLTPKQNADMASSDNWECLCCVHSKQAFREYTSTLRLDISTQKCAPLLPPVPSSTTAVGLESQLPAAFTHSSKPCPQGSEKIAEYNDEATEDTRSPNFCNEKRCKVGVDECSSADSHERQSEEKKPKKKLKREESDSSPCSPRLPLKVEAALPPVSTDLDEVYYFSQYVGGCGRSGSGTEDVCFLCKDGGGLIECDHGRRGKSRAKGVVGCKKVYHEYCLGYEIPAEQNVWVCLRHFCALCATESTAFQCQTCPLSCCRSCFFAWNDKNKFNQFADLSTVPQESVGSLALKMGSRNEGIGKRAATRKRIASAAVSSVTRITCGSCLRMFERSFARGLLKREECELGFLRNASELRGSSGVNGA